MCLTFLGYAKTTFNSSASFQLPETYVEAVNHVYDLLSDIDRDYVKDVPFFDLIKFHRGWGMNIRNSLGLWGKNKDLLASCAKANGTERIHPENASQLIIEGVWKKLNNDVSLIDFSKLEESIYFSKIHETIQLAKKSNNHRLMLSLPSWVYKQWQYWDNNEDRWITLSNEAKTLLKAENELSDLALLFLSQSPENLNVVNGKLKQKLDHLDQKDIFLPEFIIDTEERNTMSELRTLNAQDFALKCYGMLYNKTFESLKDYKQWMTLRNDNILVHWKYADKMTKNDFKSLINQPRQFLEILILTNQYYDIDEHNSGLIYRYNSYDGVVDSLATFLELDNKVFNEEPYDPAIKKRPYNSLDSVYNKKVMKAINVLAHIANCIPTKELFEMLQPEAIVNYENNLKAEGLLDYKYVVGFLLATQKQKILAYPNNDEVFNIIKYYWNQEFISWPMQYYIAELLVQINLDMAKVVFSPEFEKIPDHGSFTRNAILKALIKYNFKNDEDFLREWYWKIQDKEFLTVPREWQYILSLLRDTNDETNTLYQSIINDSRFSRPEFFKDN